MTKNASLKHYGGPIGCGRSTYATGLKLGKLGIDLSSCRPRPLNRGDEVMEKDRILGSAKEVKGKVKEAVGKAVDDAKLEAEGTGDKIEGKVQNAVGELKDAIKGK